MATRTDQILACPADKPHGLGQVLSIFSLRRVHRRASCRVWLAGRPPYGSLATAKTDRTL